MAETVYCITDADPFVQVWTKTTPETASDVYQTDDEIEESFGQVNNLFYVNDETVVGKYSYDGSIYYFLFHNMIKYVQRQFALDKKIKLVPVELNPVATEKFNDYARHINEVFKPHGMLYSKKAGAFKRYTMSTKPKKVSSVNKGCMNDLRKWAGDWAVRWMSEKYELSISIPHYSKKDTISRIVCFAKQHGFMYQDFMNMNSRQYPHGLGVGSSILEKFLKHGCLESQQEGTRKEFQDWFDAC